MAVFVAIRATFRIPRRLAGLWQAGDSVIVGKALLGAMRNRIQKRHEGSDDAPMREYSDRYALWKSTYGAWLATRIASVGERTGRRTRRKLTTAQRELRTRQRRATRGAARFAVSIGANSAGGVPVTLTLRNRHLRSLKITRPDDEGFWIEAPMPYAGQLEAQRPHLEPSPDDLRRVRGIAVRILRSRLKAYGVGRRRK